MSTSGIIKHLGERGLSSLYVSHGWSSGICETGAAMLVYEACMHDYVFNQGNLTISC